jgi:2-polyprenyl-3-methyl-5-hydroxy-6-metoxy-1,4-benzoquinol methylase
VNPVHDISLDEQIRKFSIKSLRGFTTVLVFGIGRRLGIFDFLEKKSEELKRVEKISSISFKFDELADQMKFNYNYLEAWLHMAIECGILERDNLSEKCFKTAPFVIDILVNRNSRFYTGNLLGCFYYTALLQETMFKNFPTGNIETWFNLPPNWYKDAQLMSGQQGVVMEKLFGNHLKNFKKKIKKNGKILEVGSGYGFNLEYWMKKYKNAHIVGIDIDPKAVSSAKKIIDNYNFDDRIEIKNISAKEYSKNNKGEFDLIILNQVLHEMDPHEDFRKEILEDLYLMLKDDGILLVGESMISDVFTVEDKYQFFEVMHKWFEVVFGFRFYNESSFKELILSTSFTQAELIRESFDYIWIVRK